MEAPTDEQLLTDYVSGMTDRFELLVRRHSQELFRFLVRFTGNVASAEDVVQETFLQVHLSADRFDTTRRFKPWLFTIAANKARDSFRSKARRPVVPLDVPVGGSDDESQKLLDFLSDSAPGPSEPLEQEEERQRVRRIVDALPDHLREVLVLGYFHKFPYKEMAEILQIPLGTVKSRLHAAVFRFGQTYQEEVQEEQPTEGIARGET